MKNHGNLLKNLACSGILLLALGQIPAFAGEIRLGVTDSSTFASGTLPGGRSFEAFKFTLPNIPQGSRIDYAGLMFHVQRDSVRNKYLPLSLLPIASDWTANSVQGGQLPSVDSTFPAFAVAFADSGDKVEMNITDLVSAWLKGAKTNRGFMLVPGVPVDLTRLSIPSTAGVKVKVVVYYTGPEVTSSGVSATGR